MAELLEGNDKEEFLREVKEYTRQVNIDKNAPWPKADSSSRSLRGWDSWDDKHWTPERFGVDGCAMAFHRPRKPLVGAFKPDQTFYRNTIHCTTSCGKSKPASRGMNSVLITQLQSRCSNHAVGNTIRRRWKQSNRIGFVTSRQHTTALV